MNKEQRLEEYQEDVDYLSVSDLEACGQLNFANWNSLYWYWIMNNSMPPQSGGDRPPHKPPTP